MRPTYEESTKYLSQFEVTRGGFNDLDYRNLEYLLLQYSHTPLSILEIGSWTGLSSCLLAYYAELFSGKLFCVDDFSGDGGLVNQSIFQTKNILISHLAHYYLYKYVDIYQTQSINIKSKFIDNFFDIIFIDGNHDLPFIKEDIINSLTKLKQNGILIGHDYKHSTVNETVSYLLPGHKSLNSLWYYKKI